MCYLGHTYSHCNPSGVTTPLGWSPEIGDNTNGISHHLICKLGLVSSFYGSEWFPWRQVKACICYWEWNVKQVLKFGQPPPLPLPSPSPAQHDTSTAITYIHDTYLYVKSCPLFEKLLWEFSVLIMGHINTLWCIHTYVHMYTKMLGDKPTLDYNVRSIISLCIMPEAVGDTYVSIH